MSSRSEHYCAFCSLPYRSYTQKHVGWNELFWATTFSATLMWFFWGEVHPLGFILWLSVLAWSETFLRIRWRSSLKCTHCGFDPMLYKSSPERAATAVKEFLERRKSDPNYLLKPQPKLPRHRTAGSPPEEGPRAEM